MEPVFGTFERMLMRSAARGVRHARRQMADGVDHLREVFERHEAERYLVAKRHRRQMDGELVRAAVREAA